MGIAKAVKVVNLPGLPPKGDVSDWLDAGGTLDQLSELVKAARCSSLPHSAQPSRSLKNGRRLNLWGSPMCHHFR